MPDHHGNQYGVKVGEDTIYFTQEEPQWDRQVIEDDQHDDPSIILFLRFTPTNGYQAGNVMRVPYHQVNGIIELSR
jgi:hypothetical protein